MLTTCTCSLQKSVNLLQLFHLLLSFCDPLIITCSPLLSNLHTPKKTISFLRSIFWCVPPMIVVYSIRLLALMLSLKVCQFLGPLILCNAEPQCVHFPLTFYTSNMFIIWAHAALKNMLDLDLHQHMYHKIIIQACKLAPSLLVHASHFSIITVSAVWMRMWSQWAVFV